MRIQGCNKGEVLALVILSWVLRNVCLLKIFYVYLLLEKLVNRKNFPVKINLTWFLEKCFLKKFKWKTLSGSCEKFRNVTLFADYIKFGSQTFDCYIYFVLNIYFLILSLKI